MALSFSLVTGQNVSGTSVSGDAVSLSFASPPTLGNLVCLAILYYGGSGTTILSVVDGNSNAYVVSPNSPSAYDSSSGQIFLAYLLSAPANAHQTITVTFNNTPEVAAIWMAEFSYTGGPIALDMDIIGAGTGTTINTPTVTVSENNELAFAGCAYGGTLTSADSPWTAVAAVRYGCLAEYDLSVSSNQALAFTDSEAWNWRSMGMTFKSGAGGSVSITDSGSASDLLGSLNVSLGLIDAGEGKDSSPQGVWLLVPDAGIAWGEGTPDADELARSWQQWEKSAGVPGTVDGDADYGNMQIDANSHYSSVQDFGNATEKTFTILRNKYASGVGNTTVYIRGSANAFAKWDASPSWNEYAGNTTQSWRYVQVKVDKT